MPKRAKPDDDDLSNTQPKKRRKTIVEKGPTVPDIEDVPYFFQTSEITDIRSKLVDWYDKEQRKLPWRMPFSDWQQRIKETEENHLEQLYTLRAYQVWVSEIMLQQTRVQTVIGYYNRWFEKFPTVDVLAAATLEEVNELWAGLGYYRRARFLHEGSKQIIDSYNSIFPKNAVDVQKLAGIGQYTAGAISSIVFNQPVPVVDGNVFRVLSRLRMINEDPKQKAKLFWEIAGTLVDPDRPGCFNQAMMELGATVCTTANPNCKACPISANCLAYLKSQEPNSEVQITDFPVKTKKAPPRLETIRVCIVCRLKKCKVDLKNLKANGKFLIVQRPETGLLASLWEFPNQIEAQSEKERNVKKNTIQFLTKGNSWVNEEDIWTFKSLNEPVTHLFSHIKQTILVDYCLVKKKKSTDSKTEEERPFRWVSYDELQTAAISKGMQKCFQLWQLSFAKAQKPVTEFFKKNKAT